MPSITRNQLRQRGGNPNQELLATPSRARNKAAKPSKTTLTHYNNLPAWLRDNEYIVHGYRVDWSVWDSIKSIWRVHNETGNIWTHLIGFLVFVMLTVATAYVRPQPFLMTKDLLWRLEGAVVEAGRHGMHDLYELEQRMVRAGLNGMSEFQAHVKEILDIHAVLKRYNVESIAELEARVLRAGKGGVDALGHELHAVRTRLQASMQHNWRSLQAVTGLLDIRWPTARWPVYVFLAGAMVCLLTSTVCHTLGCCSQHVAQWIWRVDYCGIAVLIVASFYPPLYYCFQCSVVLKWMYLGATTAMGIAAVCVSLMPVFQTTEYRAFRAGMFAGMGLWGLVPMLHGIVIYWGQPEVERALLWDLLMGALYLLGAGVYAMRVPERWKPGAFDIAFHSHQLFHVAVVLAAAVHYKAVLILLRWRDATLCM